VTPIIEPTVTPIGPDEEAETTGKWMAEKMRQNGVTDEIRSQIGYYLNYFTGKAKEIFVAHISNHPEIEMTP
jgi:hypothetical protein